MYTELLNIIYTYVFNYKEPDKHFLEDVLDIAINKDNLREYIKEIDYNYDYNAAYGFTSKTLRFNVANILEYAKKSFNFYKNSYEPIINISDLEEYICLSLMFILTILHELEHAKQIKTLETTNGNTFEKSLIQNSLDIISINPDFYRKEHDLFPTERMAIINSTSKLIEILKIDGDFSLFINEVFVKEYNWFINNYYIHKNIPLLEYINISGIHLYYEDILINKENSKK